MKRDHVLSVTGLVVGNIFTGNLFFRFTSRENFWTMGSSKLEIPFFPLKDKFIGIPYGIGTSCSDLGEPQQQSCSFPPYQRRISKVW